MSDLLTIGCRMDSHDRILPWNWSISSPFDGQIRKSYPATAVVDHWVTHGSLSIPTSQRSVGAHIAEFLS